jgi:hypothetical protein
MDFFGNNCVRLEYFILSICLLFLFKFLIRFFLHTFIRIRLFHQMVIFPRLHSKLLTYYLFIQIKAKWANRNISLYYLINSRQYK